MTDIKAATAKLLKNDFQIDESVTALLFAEGIIQEHIVKKVLINREYKLKAIQGEKQRLKHKIADKYCVSVELIEKIIKK